LSELVVGSGAFRYRWVSGWGRLPDGLTLGDVPGVAVDSRDRVFALQRGEPPVVVFDRDGAFVASWGDGVFKRTHGIHIAADDSVYCVDDVGQAVRRFSPDGRLELEITAPDQTEVTGYRRGYHRSVQRSAPPFCFPTAAAPSHDGRHVMVTDGYGNARLHRFDGTGELVSSFGDPGDGPSQFIIPHGIHIESDGRMFVSDRENERAQIFSASGELVGAWTGMSCPNNIVRGPDGNYYTAELGRTVQGPPGAKHVVEDALSPRITVRDSSGAILAEWGAPEPDRVFFAPHGIAIDSRGDLYVGEVSASNSHGLAPPRAALHKFVRVD
jgi:DNA-binding beta-propeller fold protein YncE